MDKKKLLRDRLDKLAELVRLLSALIITKNNEWHLEAFYNDKKYSIDCHETSDKTACTLTTYNILTIKSDDNRELNIQIRRYEGDETDEYDTDSISYKITYKLDDKRSLKIGRGLGNIKYRDLLSFSKKDLLETNGRVNDDSITLDFLSNDFRMVDFKLIKYFVKKDFCGNVVFSKDGKTILYAEGKPIPNIEELENYNIDEAIKRCLESNDKATTLEELKAINKEINEITNTYELYKRVLNIYKEVTEFAQITLNKQNIYYELFKEAYFTDDELTFIENEISHLVNRVIDEDIIEELSSEDISALTKSLGTR